MPETDSNSARRLILLFVSYPEAEQPRNRKSSKATTNPIAEQHKASVARLCERLPQNVPVVVHFDSRASRKTIVDWLISLLPLAAGWEPQAQAGTGEILRQAVAWSFATGWGEVAVIRNPHTRISQTTLIEAFESLATHDAAIVPSLTGDYDLLALRKPQPQLFEEIRWNTEHSLKDTLERGADLQIKLLHGLEQTEPSPVGRDASPISKR